MTLVLRLKSTNTTFEWLDGLMNVMALVCPTHVFGLRVTTGDHVVTYLYLACGYFFLLLSRRVQNNTGANESHWGQWVSTNEYRLRLTSHNLWCRHFYVNCNPLHASYGWSGDDPMDLTPLSLSWPGNWHHCPPRLEKYFSARDPSEFLAQFRTLANPML